MRADIPDAILRRDRSLAALAAEPHDSAGSGKMQGLTQVEDRLAFHTRVRTVTSQNGTCAWFDEARVDLTPASVQIYLPREYPEDSCEYLAVLNHEREHERVHRERLAAASADIERALAAARWLPARGNPFQAEDRASAEAALDAKLRKVVSPIYLKYKADLAAAQAELDKPELYQWVTKRCAGWK